MHEHQNWPSWAHRRAQARACLAVSWALRPCRGLAARSYRGPSGRVMGAGYAPARPYRRHSAARWLAVSWAGCVVLQHSPAFPPQACHNTICLYCDTGFLTSLTACCITIHCIAIQLSSSPKSFSATIQPIVLRYNLPQSSSLLQYNSPCFVTSLSTPFSHDTNFVS